MKEAQAALLEEARQSIDAAETLLDRGHIGYAAARAYYAMFYIASAFLEGEGKQFSKHSALIASFGRDFANVGRVPVKFHRYLLKGMEIRLEADYGLRHNLTVERAREQIDRADEFLRMAEEWIEKQANG